VKILHLTGDREDLGGVLSVIRNLATATRPWGWKHVVWVNHAFEEKRPPALACRRSRHIIGDCPAHWRLAWSAFLAWGELRELLRHEPFDILHAHTRGTLLVALLAAARLGRRVIFTNHNYARRVGLYRWAAGCKNLTTVLLTPNMARHYRLVAPTERVKIISACCADELFVAPLVARAGGNPACTLCFAGLGSVVRWKNWHLVLQAVAQLPPAERARVRFSLWGPTPDEPDARRYENELRDFIGRHHLEQQVFLRGATAEAAKVLREADWLLQPSTNEPCSVAVMEALALGVPVIVSASGGSVDIVQDERSGLFFQPDSAADLARQLGRILRGEIRPLPPAEIRETVRVRAATAVAAQYRELYEQLRA